MNIDEIRLIDSEIKRLLPIFKNEFLDYILPQKFMYFRDKSNWNEILDFGSGIGVWNDGNKIYVSVQNSRFFKQLSKEEGYGENKGKQLVSNKEYYINNKDFLDYIDYAKANGLKEIDYALDTLPHHIMHLIGSGKGILGEGITELRTREICKKYNIRYAPVMHSKEAKLIRLLENFFTKQELNEASFYGNVSSILKKCETIFGKEFKTLYEDICGQYNNYISSSVTDVVEHYKRYREIDFTKLYDLIKRKLKKSE